MRVKAVIQSMNTGPSNGKEYEEMPEKPSANSLKGQLHTIDHLIGDVKCDPDLYYQLTLLLETAIKLLRYAEQSC